MTDLRVGHFYIMEGEMDVTIPRINSAHGDDTRNIINRSIDVTNELGKRIQDLVAEGQLTPQQYGQLMSVVNGNIKKGDVSVYDINKNLGKLDGTFFDDKFLENLKEGEINVTNVLPKSVTVDKTTFIRSAHNFFDADNVTNNTLIDSDGNIVTNSDYVTTGFIPVEGARNLKRSIGAFISQYRNDRSVTNEFSARSAENTVELRLYSYTDKIRISVRKDRMNVMDVRYTDVSDYPEESNSYYIDNLKVDERHINRKILESIDTATHLNEITSTLKDNSYPNKVFGITDYKNDSVNAITSNTQIQVDSNLVLAGETLKVTCNHDATNHIIFDYRNSPKKLKPAHTVGFYFYLDDEAYTDINRIRLQLYMSEDLQTIWDRSTEHSEVKFKKGWNILRLNASDGSMGDWENIHRIRIMIYKNSQKQTTLNLGQLFIESSDKAKIIIVNDGARKSWRDVAYQKLKQRRFPTTWAINPNTFGSTEDKMTEEDILNLRNDLESSFSFHSWGSGTPTSQMTERETREDAVRCIRYLKANGLASDYLWRAAVHQNNAPHHRVNDDLLMASATYTGDTGRGGLAFPFVTPYNIGRIVLHGLTNADMDVAFNLLKKTRGVSVFYTHGVYDGGSAVDMSTEQLNYFLTKIDSGVSEGWLEGASFEDLFKNIDRVENTSLNNMLVDKLIQNYL